MRFYAALAYLPGIAHQTSALNKFETEHDLNLSRTPCQLFSTLTNSSAAHRTRSLTFTVLTSILCYGLTACCGPNSSTNCSSGRIGPSGAEVYGTIIGVGAVITAGTLLEVNHSHHTMNGCAVSGPSGLELHTQGGNKTYMLTGDTAAIKPGDHIRIHGSKVKKNKGVTVDTFSVEKVNRDYGPCKVTHP